jgi:hypothetical protein
VANRAWFLLFDRALDFTSLHFKVVGNARERRLLVGIGRRAIVDPSAIGCLAQQLLAMDLHAMPRRAPPIHIEASTTSRRFPMLELWTG